MTDNEQPRSVKDGTVYLSVEDIISAHDLIIEEDPNAEPGLESIGDIEYILDHIEYGAFDEGPESIHEKAFQLLRLLAADHPFVDGNKRTALASAVLFYAWNGYHLEYQEELEAMLILISIREDLINPAVAVEYLGTITTFEQDLWVTIFLDGIEEFIPDFDYEHGE